MNEFEYNIRFQCAKCQLNSITENGVHPCTINANYLGNVAKKEEVYSILKG